MVTETTNSNGRSTTAKTGLGLAIGALGVTIADITITAGEAEEFFTKTIPQVSPSIVNS